MGKRCIITGASSGIGLELARELARRGWSLALLARRADLLEQLAAELKLAGREVVAIPCDVTDSEAVQQAVEQGEALLGGPFELAIANAGIGVPSHGANFKLPEAELMIKVNVLGVMYLFAAVVPGMVERRSGHFVGVASVAGYRGLPSSSVYSCSKAAMHSFLEASRIELLPYDVQVTTVNPGFVTTPMTEKNRFKMPFLMDAPKAARIIADGIDRRQRVIEFPLRMSLLMKFTRLLPNAIYERATVGFARRKVKS